eukprot:4765118-Ditylum_brightwellii.AAC.1
MPLSCKVIAGNSSWKFTNRLDPACHMERLALMGSSGLLQRVRQDAQFCKIQVKGRSTLLPPGWSTA